MSFSNNNLTPVAVIGAGRVGRALSGALHKNGAKISAVISRSMRSAERCAKDLNCAIVSQQLFDLPDSAKTIFVTTPDQALPGIARKLVELNFDFNKKLVAHTSGALTSEVFAPLKQRGALVASFHPIQTFAGDEFDSDKLSGIYFGIEGNGEALAICKKLVKLLGGKYIIIPKDMKTLYHAACVFTSNYLIALMDIPVELLNRFLPDRDETAKILLPLLETTVENIRKVGLDRALTGPISRGDVETVQKHLEILKKEYAELLPIYCGLGKQALKLSKKRGGIDGLTFKTLQRILELNP
jgi:predicted short-subunit dehydrogenase-like oxidoreductase (DUF2520 family)